MSNSCPFPKSSMVTDLLVDCSTNIISVVQTSPAGTETTQSVDLSCIIPPHTQITSATYDCVNDQLIIVQTTEGACNGPECIETFTVDLGCIKDGVMPSCDNLASVTPPPVGSEIIVCTPGGAFKSEIGGLITELDCSKLPPAASPRPPQARFIMCDNGKMASLDPIDVFTCDDIPFSSVLSSNPSVVVCGDAGMAKVPLDKIRHACSDYPLQDPAPQTYNLLACDGANFISVPKVVSRITDVVEGEGIDVGLIAGSDTDTFTVTLDLCELQSDTFDNLNTPGPVYMAVCANGQNYKIPYVESSGGTILADGNGTALSGDGSAATPYVIDVALCELEDNVTYDENTELIICSGVDSKRMPAIKAGANVTIDSATGALSATTPPGSVEVFGSGLFVPLWDQTMESSTTPDYSATVTVTPNIDELIVKDLVVYFEAACMATIAPATTDTLVTLTASIDGIKVADAKMWIKVGSVGGYNQFNGEFFIPFSGGTSVDVALNWTITGGVDSNVSLETKATIVGTTRLGA